jgi:hypothetical protein
MSDAASKEAKPEEEAFVEHDDRATLLPYDKGGVPIYIALLWVAFIITYIVVMTLVALPDLRSWMGSH